MIGSTDQEQEEIVLSLNEDVVQEVLDSIIL